MPLGYKYAERSADAQINWAEVGREASGMLLDWHKAREEKKEAYDQADRESINNLMDTPQGKDQDANTFINNFAHDMIEQKKANQDLFKRGMIKEREYTLMNQNNMDGTKQLFEIQKLYQQKYAEKMEGVTSGKLQALNIFNMGMVEGYGDFNNSRATINPVDGTVGIGLMETKIVDGKTVRVLSKNIAPVNVIRGKIVQDVPTFDVDAATSNTVKNFGSRKDVVYNHATTAGAGSIYEYLGIDFLATLKDPVDIKIVEDTNKAINDQVDSFLSPYNITSVLTENLRKYNDKSFTFDKDVADNDASKILVKIDPNTQMTTIDEEGKNYKTQKAEAAQWVRDDILRKMDQERGVKPTAQNELQETADAKAKAENKYRPKTDSEYKREDEAASAKEFARQLNNLTVGDSTAVINSLPYFQSLLENDKGESTGIIKTTPQGIQIKMTGGETKLYKYDNNGKLANPKELQRQLVTALNSQGLNDDMIGKELDKLYDPNKKLNTKAHGGGYERNYEKEISNKVADNVSAKDFYKQGSDDTAAKLTPLFTAYNKANPKKRITIQYETGAGDDIYIYQNGTLISTLNSDEDDLVTAKGRFDDLMKVINKLDKDEFLGYKKKAAGGTGSASKFNKKE